MERGDLAACHAAPGSEFFRFQGVGFGFEGFRVKGFCRCLDLRALGFGLLGLGLVGYPGFGVEGLRFMAFMAHMAPPKEIMHPRAGHVRFGIVLSFVVLRVLSLVLLHLDLWNGGRSHSWCMRVRAEGTRM